MNIKLDKYNPLIMYLSPASIPQIVAHIQDYLVKHPILSVETIAEIIVQSLQEHPELINGEAIPISAESQQSIKAYIDALPFLDTYTKAEINTLLLGKQDTLTFDQAPTPGSSNPVTSSGIIAAMSALQSALETQISNKADRASTYTKTQVDTLLDDKANADDVYSKNTMDAKLLEINTDIDNLDDELSHQSQQIANAQNGLAYIVGNTNTTGSILANGAFVYVKGHSTIAEGLRKVTASISVNGSITTNNTEACTEGGLNALNSNISGFKFKNITPDASGAYEINFAYSSLTAYAMLVGRFGYDSSKLSIAIISHNRPDIAYVKCLGDESVTVSCSGDKVTVQMIHNSAGCMLISNAI